MYTDGNVNKIVITMIVSKEITRNIYRMKYIVKTNIIQIL